MLSVEEITHILFDKLCPSHVSYTESVVYGITVQGDPYQESWRYVNLTLTPIRFSDLGPTGPEGSAYQTSVSWCTWVLSILEVSGVDANYKQLPNPFDYTETKGTHGAARTWHFHTKPVSVLLTVKETLC